MGRKGPFSISFSSLRFMELLGPWIEGSRCGYKMTLIVVLFAYRTGTFTKYYVDLFV